MSADGYGLVLAFDRPGPCHDFTMGVECGRLWEQLKNPDGFSQAIHERDVLFGPPGFVRACFSLDDLSRMAGERWAREDREREGTPDPSKTPKTEAGRARPFHGGVRPRSAYVHRTNPERGTS